MKAVKYLHFAAILLILCASLALAQEAPRYNFGSMQPEKSLVIEPGKSITTKLYFYNIHGNRITHIVLSIASAPQGWDIKIEPGLHLQQYNVSGILVNITENLFVEPREPLAEKPETAEEGIEYLTASGVSGYIPAKVVRITITSPKNAPLGKRYGIKINAIATWLGQSGAGIVSQERSFDYEILTQLSEFREEVVKGEKEEIKTGQEIKREYIFYGVIVLLLVVIIILLYALRKKQGS